MLWVRDAEERGLVELDWLTSRHTFSFGRYYDSNFMGFGPLRVINEDRVKPGKGFSAHGHEDMEIISYVIDGALEHKDSLGNGSIIRPGDVQRMSAGTGVVHSEYNPSDAEPVHFLQIWIIPEARGLEPSYEQTRFTPDERAGRWLLVGSHDGCAGSVTIHQDIEIYATLLTAGRTTEHQLDSNRLGWLQVVRGEIEMGEQPLNAGDGVAIQGPYPISVTARADSEALLFDMTA